MTTLQDITGATNLARAQRKALGSQQDEDGRDVKRRRLDLELEWEFKMKNTQLDSEIAERKLETKRKNAQLDSEIAERELDTTQKHLELHKQIFILARERLQLEKDRLQLEAARSS